MEGKLSLKLEDGKKGRAELLKGQEKHKTRERERRGRKTAENCDQKNDFLSFSLVLRLYSFFISKYKNFSSHLLFFFMLVFIFCLAIIKIYLDAFAGCEVEGERWRNGAEKTVEEKKNFVA